MRAVLLLLALLAGWAPTLEAQPALFGQETQLTGLVGAPSDRFGAVVSLSGNTAAVKARDSVYVFVRSPSVWTLQQKLTAADTTGVDSFGSSVAISGDTLVVNARLERNPGFYGGAAYVFVRSGTVWTLQQRLVPPDSTNFFGISVSLSGDTAVIGASHHLAPPQNAGAAYVFGRTGSTWSLRQKLTATDRAGGDAFGRSVSLSGDTIVVGADLDDLLAGDEGSAYVFGTGAGYFPLTPCRVVDTRISGGALDPLSATTFTVGGVCQVPADARAVAANLIAVNPGDVGDLRIYPAGMSGFIPSSINFAAGRTRANNGVISLGVGGQVTVFCNMPALSTGTTHFVLDVFGYFR